MGRNIAIDYLKACAIVTVVWIHAFATLDPAPGRAIYILTQLALFAVPSFFFVSGFLYFSPEAITWSQVQARLKRILIPYLAASLFAEVFKAIDEGQRPTAENLLIDLVLGNSLLSYYFIPVLALAVLLAMFLSRMPRSVIPLFASFWIMGILSTTHIIGSDLFWKLRSPLHWWGFFLAGWAIAPYWPRIVRASRERRIELYSFMALATTAYLVFLFRQKYFGYQPRVAACGYAFIYLMIGGILLGSLSLRARRQVFWLSEATYPIYLYHYFVLAPVREALADSPWSAGLASWAAGLAGSILFCIAASRWLGPKKSALLLGVRSRTMNSREWS